jgi:hypothetical protein
MAQLDLAFRLLSGPLPQFIAVSADAVLANQQAVAAGNDPVTIASALRTLSSWASGAPAPQAAVDAIDAAAVILRAAAPTPGDEATYYRTLAIVLFDLFWRLVAAGQRATAAPPAEEAVAAYRKLAAAGERVIDVSDALMTLSVHASRAAQPDPTMPVLPDLATAAVDAALAAVSLLEAPAATPEDDEERRARLAQDQLVLAQRLVVAGRPAEAVDAARAAVALYEVLAAADSSYGGLLAQAQAYLGSLG